MDRAVEFYFCKGIAGTTARRHEGAWRRYTEVCRSMVEELLVVLEVKAIAYIVTLAGEGVQLTTVSTTWLG